MGVLKNILNSVNGMWVELRELKKLQDPTNKVKAEAFDKLNETLAKAQGGIKVRNISAKIDEKGNDYVEIRYQPIIERVYVDNNGETNSTPLFKALNHSDLVSFKDQMKIRDAIDKQIRNIRD